MSVFDTAAQKRTFDRVQQLDQQARKHLRASFSGVPLGMEPVPDDVWAAEQDRIAAQWGIGTVVNEETGVATTGSLYFMALEFCDGGREILNAYNRIRGKDGAE